jgi:hypothetical protein
MNNKIAKILIILSILTVNLSASAASLKEVAQKNRDIKINKYLIDIDKVETDINVSEFGYNSTRKVSDDSKSYLDISNGYATPLKRKITYNEKPIGLRLGCSGITYDGAIEQVGIGYLELLRDAFVDYTEPYICSETGEVPLLEQYAFKYAMAICLVEVGSILATGEDLDGNKITNINLQTLTQDCAGNITNGSSFDMGANGNATMLTQMKGRGGIGLGGSFAVMKCIYEGLEDSPLIKFLDTCLTTNRNDFIQFVMEMSDINFSVDLSIQKLRVEQCEKIMDQNGNGLNIKLGMLDLFGDTDEKGKPTGYKNINGMLLNYSNNSVSQQDDTLHGEIRTRLGYPLSAPKEAKPVIKNKLLNDWEDATKNLRKFIERRETQNALDCLDETGELYADTYSDILSSYNLGINKLIYMINDEIIFSFNFIKQNKSIKLSEKCRYTSIKNRIRIMKKYKKLRENLLTKYFYQAQSVLTDTVANKLSPNSVRSGAVSEKLYSNGDTGYLNLQIEKYNMDRVKRRGDYYLKSKIINFIYTHDIKAVK